MTKKIRVLQLIDSFDIGGAERICINFANSLANIKNIDSYVCATRKTGKLESTINKNVKKLILDKKSTFDIKAIIKLIKFVKEYDINIIHAHSSSFFMGIIVKIFTNIKLIWHDHNGNRYKFSKKENNSIKFFSKYFDYVFVVSDELILWSIGNLKLESSKISFIQNFPELIILDKITELPGIKEKRIVCLANLRWQKDHMMLLKAFNIVLKEYLDYHLLLIGDDKNDDYSKELKDYIIQNKLNKNIHILGSRIDSGNILINSSIGIISSKSEGLPVSLLEYGLAGLSVISTDVGDCSKVLNNGEFGKIIPKDDYESLSISLINLISNKRIRELNAIKFKEHIEKSYSKYVVIEELINRYKEVLELEN